MFLKDIPYALEQYVNPNPTMVIGGVSIVNDIGPQGANMRVMNITKGSGMGFVDVPTSKKWMMRVSDKLNYEISFWFKQPVEDPAFELSINCFSKHYVAKNTYNITTGTVENMFFSAGDRVAADANRWYFARYCLFNAGRAPEPAIQPITSLSVGTNLIMEPGTTNVIINVLGRNGDLRLCSLQFKPLDTPFSTGFLQGGNLLEVWRKNNNAAVSEQTIDQLAADELFDYNVGNKIIHI